MALVKFFFVWRFYSPPIYRHTPAAEVVSGVAYAFGKPRRIRLAKASLILLNTVKFLCAGTCKFLGVNAP
jgi:hypothetical protein